MLRAMATHLPALLALLLAAGGAQAQIFQMGEREVCVHNATTTMVRAEIEPDGLADAFVTVAPGARHCRRFPRQHGAQAQAEAFAAGQWVQACPERALPAALGNVTLTVIALPPQFGCRQGG